jgi:hypothetical protein
MNKLVQTVDDVRELLGPEAFDALTLDYFQYDPNATEAEYEATLVGTVRQMQVGFSLPAASEAVTSMTQAMLRSTGEHEESRKLALELSDVVNDFFLKKNATNSLVISSLLAVTSGFMGAVVDSANAEAHLSQCSECAAQASEDNRAATRDAKIDGFVVGG